MKETDIAIIGISARFPGAANSVEYWANLANGMHALSRSQEDDLIAAGVGSSIYSKPNYVNAGYVLNNIDLFDAEFFGMAPRDAEILDPQHRILLECAWEALEDAGQSPDNVGDGTGVFAGAFVSSYWLQVMSNPSVMQAVGPMQLRHANDKDYVATRISYKLNLTGPSLSVQTSCSSSLMAVHLACQSLISSECDLALAGGVSVNVPEKAGYVYEQGGVLSTDGYCRTFDRKASGTNFGSGAGMVALKRLPDAIRDRDHIYSVIKSTAANNDGARKVGFTAPSVEGQARVILEALTLADIPFESISYVEAHGTGTLQGDPIEIEALTQAFRQQTQNKGFCAIGSVKTNIGHSGAASGIAGLIKTALAFKHKQLPPTLHFEQANPQINFQESPFFVNTQLKEWKPGLWPRRAGVSSFGMGGTNVHAILEEAPILTTEQGAQPAYLLPLSARTGLAVLEYAKHIAAHLRQRSDQLGDVAYTLQTGRKEFAQRCFVVAASKDEAVAKLEECARQPLGKDDQRKLIPETYFLFPGEGSQYAKMAKGLFDHQIIFRREFEQCAQLLQPLLKQDICELLLGEESADRTELAQPVLFSVEYALARMWQELGVQPTAMLGHSLGEYVAACLAGVFSLSDALFLVTERGRLFASSRGGAMLAIQITREEIEHRLPADVEIAAVNSPSLYTVAGESKKINELKRALDQQGYETSLLTSSHALHSRLIEPCLADFKASLDRVQLYSPKIPFISNVTGNWITEGEATSREYWLRHSKSCVMFGPGIAKLISKSATAVFLEIGPGNSLCSMAKAVASFTDACPVTIATLRQAKQKADDYEFFLENIGQLWKLMVPICWTSVQSGRYHKTSLPTYPFQRRRYWIESASADKVQDTTPGSSVIDKSEISAVEDAVEKIFKEVLGISQIGPDDTFFALGGNSLSALQAVSKLRAVFSCEIPLEELLATPTIRHITSFIESKLSLMSSTEQLVASLFKEVLGLSDVDKNADFFALGGNSLSALRVVARIRSELALDVPLAELLVTPSIVGIAKILDQRLHTEERAVSSIDEVLAEIESLTPDQVRTQLTNDDTREASSMLS